MLTRITQSRPGRPRRVLVKSNNLLSRGEAHSEEGGRRCGIGSGAQRTTAALPYRVRPTRDRGIARTVRRRTLTDPSRPPRHAALYCHESRDSEVIVHGS